MKDSFQTSPSELLKSERPILWAREARWAASGGNSQPWRVAIEPKSPGDRVVFVLRIEPSYAKAPSPMDVDARAAIVALGCYSVYLESFAARDGYALKQSVVNRGASSWDVEISLEFAPVTEQSVANGHSTEALAARWTDRRKYPRSVDKARQPGFRFSFLIF